MSRKTWYFTLLIFEVILYLTSYSSSVMMSNNAQNLNGDTLLISSSSIFSIWDGIIICWFIWRIMKSRVDVEGLIIALLISITQLLMFFLPPYFYINPINTSFVLNIICLIWICLIIKNVERREVLINWKSKTGWQSSIVNSVLIVASINLSAHFLFISMDRNSKIFAFTLQYTVIELIFLLLLNVMITIKSYKLQKVYSLLLIFTCLLKIVLVYSFSSSISIYGLFYLLLSIYIASRIFGLLSKVADRWESKVKIQDVSTIETKGDIKSSQLEEEVEVNNQLNAENNEKENSSKGFILNSSWLWSALIISVSHLSFFVLPLFLGDPMYLLILFVGGVHYICFIIAIFLLFRGMRQGNEGLLNAAAILFIVSVLGTPDSYWIGPNLLSFILGVLVLIGRIFPNNLKSKIQR